VVSAPVAPPGSVSREQAYATVLKILGIRPTRPQAEFIMFPHRFKYLSGGEQAGKALCLTTPIITPKGWRVMGDLQPGDQVFDDEGIPCFVTGSRVWLNRPRYRLSFDDGTSIVADEDHEWVTETSLGRRVRLRRSRKGQTSLIASGAIRTSKQIAETLYSRRQDTAVHSNHSITIAKPLQFAQQQLPLDPYVLGVWLGDGSAVGPYITCADAPILDEIRRRGVAATPRRRLLYVLGDKSGVFLTLSKTLAQLNVRHNKHIPRIYLESAISQRIDLLKGLMDTDGSCAKDGRSTEFYNKNERLIKDVSHLLTGLGVKHQVRSKRAKLYGKDCGTVYTISYVASFPVFTLPRKLSRQCPDGIRALRDERQRKYIVAAERLDSGSTKCIEVNSPSHLFLAGPGMIPTHNSLTISVNAVLLRLEDRARFGKGRYWIIGSDYGETEAEFDYIRSFLQKLSIYRDSSKRVDPGTIRETDGTVWETKSGMDSRKLSKFSPNGIVLCEPGQMDLMTYQKALFRVGSARGWMLGAGTLEGSLGWWPKLIQSYLWGTTDTKSIIVPSTSNTYKYKGGENDPEILRMKGQSSDQFFLERIMGVPCPPAGLVFPEFRPDIHVREVSFDPSYPVELAIDPGVAGAYAVEAFQTIGDQDICFDEVYENQMVTDDIITVCQQKPWWKNVKAGVIDVAGTYRQGAMPPVSQIWMEKASLYLSGQKVPVSDGTEALKTFLKVNPKDNRPKLVVDPRCTGLLSEFGVAPCPLKGPLFGQTAAYRWKTDKEGNVVGDEPEDKFNHAIKAVIYRIVDRYGYTGSKGRNEASIQYLRPGHGVRTPLALPNGVEASWRK